MYRAKESGRGRFAFFVPEMNARADARLALESGLHRALRDRQFVLHYQPRVAPDGRLAGAEALLRWRHPEQGLLAPERFIGLLEETGLIVPVGEWVLRSACAQSRAWQYRGLEAVRVSVNVSPQQFQHDAFVATVRAALAETGLPGPLLELELTESLLVEHRGPVTERMRALKELGVWLSIDDFGAGYSSLHYLRSFPVDLLKLDRSFLADLPGSARNRSIVEAVAGLARGLGVGLVAEGVEQAAQARFMRERGCAQMQGFWFGRPVPAAELERLLAGHAPGLPTDGLEEAPATP